MASNVTGRSKRWRSSFWMAVEGVGRLLRQDRSFGTRAASLGLALLLGIVLGALVTYVPPLYLLAGIAGGVFAFLLLFKIEIAVMLAILLYQWLAQYNYLGGDTAMHPNGVIGVAIIGGAAYFFLHTRTDFSRLRGFWPFLAFSVIALLSLLSAGEYLMDGLTVTLRLVTALAVYAVLVYRLDSVQRINWLILAVLAGQLPSTIQGLIRVVQGGGMDVVGGADIVRAGNSGIGVRLAYIVAFCLVRLLGAGTTRDRLLWGCWTGLFSMGLFFSYGRAGWIGFAVVVALIGLIKYRKLLIILPVVLILMIAFVPTVSLRFSEIDLRHLDDRSSSTIAGRIQVWRAGMEVYKRHPLLGVGYGVERYGIGEYLAQYAWMAHNDYLGVLVGTGSVGLVLFMFWHLGWLRELFRVYRRAVSPYARTMALAVFAAFAVSLAVRITDNVVQTMDKMLPLVALVAAAMALPRIEGDQGSPQDTPKTRDIASAAAGGR